MIEKIKVYRGLGQYDTNADNFELVLNNPTTYGIAITNIRGLGHTKANINIHKLPNLAGGIYNSNTIGERNIVFDLLYTGNDIERSRNNSYAIFPVGEGIRIAFFMGTGTFYIDGYVETNDPDIFSPQESASVSILCPTPYFYSTIKYEQTSKAVVPAFKFPFSNNSTTEPLLKFSDYVTQSINPVEYRGDVDYGFSAAIKVIKPFTTAVLYNVDTNESITLDFTNMGNPLNALESGDIINIGTAIGGKRIDIERNGLVHGYTNTMTPGSTFFNLHQGYNNIQLSTNLEDPYAYDLVITYNNHYRGI